MKKLSILTVLLTTVLFFQSCRKEDIKTPFEEGKTGGVIFLDPKEYDELPKVNAENLRPLIDQGIGLRVVTKTLNTPAVANQGGEGSCTAFGVGYCAMSYYLNKTKGWAYTNTGAIRSPEYLYNNTKAAGSCEAAGAATTNVLDFCLNTGVPNWNLMPYSGQNGCTTRYPQGYAPYITQGFNPKTGYYTYTVYPVIPKEKISSWKTVRRTATDIKAVIDRGYPVIMCFSVDQNFDSQTRRSPFVYTSTGGIVRGGHCVVIVGYDDNNNRFKVQNSWGTGNHENGYFYWAYNNIAAMRELYVIE